MFLSMRRDDCCPESPEAQKSIRNGCKNTDLKRVTIRNRIMIKYETAHSKKEIAIEILFSHIKININNT